MNKTNNVIANSTLTDKYQTTVPDTIRQHLGLDKQDTISYSIDSNGQVIISRLQQPEEEPVKGKFLSFLARDMSENPQRIQPINVGLVERIQSLVADVKVDLDATLSEEDE
ncbi:MAG: type II toxin-antitoxin system PrlF family antitoxin [Symploca sp. SIO1C2]|nr:type II toxin-antitoxin system PrlF family antitoxin [Symploca sp. SIO1C2]